MKARVLHVITRLDLGGAQQNTLYCARHHDRDRFDVELISGCSGNDPAFDKSVYLDYVESRADSKFLPGSSPLERTPKK